VLISIAVVTMAAAVQAGTGSPALPEQSTPPNTLRLAEGMPRPTARVADLAWLAGQWQGEGLGGTFDEVWSAPVGGAMVGYFRLVRDGKAVFYEILTLLEVDGSVEMRLKHVNPDMTGWEEKSGFVTFGLVKIDDTGAYFSGLTFRKAGPDALEAYLALRSKADGSVREEKLVYRRVK
jgi:hypothetical protein